MRPKLLLFSVGSAVLFAFIAFYAWSQNTYTADPIAYSAAIKDEKVRVEERGGFIVVEPRSVPAIRALLFYPGLRVEPKAYVPKLVKVAKATRMRIVIGRPRLNIAALSIGQAKEMRPLVGSIKEVYIGGHSLGGSMACIYAQTHSQEFNGVFLFGTYSGSDLTKTNLKVLNLIAAKDRIMDQGTIERHRKELPPDADVVVIPGMVHSQFGNYGKQAWDASPDIDDVQAGEALVAATRSFLDRPYVSQSEVISAPSSGHSLWQPCLRLTISCSTEQNLLQKVFLIVRQIMELGCSATTSFHGLRVVPGRCVSAGS